MIKKLLVLVMVCPFLSKAGVTIGKGDMDKPTRIDSIANYLKNPADNHILVAAHRADWRNYPENSLEGVKSCIAMGVDIIEIDVQRTKDGQLIIMHDKKVDRTTDGTGNVSDLTLAEIKNLHLKNGYGYATKYHVPLLEQLLEAVKGKAFLFIDKCYKYIPEAYTLIEKTGTQKEALFEGIVPLAQLSADYPDYTKKIQYMPRLNGDKKNVETTNYINEFVNAPSLVATFIMSYEKEKSPGVYYGKLIRQKGISIMANSLWPETCADHDDDVSVNDPDAGWGWLIANGSNIIITDRPEKLLKYLRENKKHQ